MCERERVYEREALRLHCSRLLQLIVCMCVRERERKRERVCVREVEVAVRLDGCCVYQMLRAHADLPPSLEFEGTRRLIVLQ